MQTWLFLNLFKNSLTFVLFDYMPKSKKPSKESSAEMPNDAQIKSAAKELENLPAGTIIVRHGFQFACTTNGHIAFQKV